jgi:membrane-associated phospholipid phosphatase
MVSQKKLFFVGICCLIAFTLFSWGIKRGAFKNADFAFTVKVQNTIDDSARLRTKALVGDVMEGSTFFASPEFSVVVVLLLTVMAAYDRKKKKIRWQAVFILIAFVFLVGAEVYGKNVVHHPAPPFFMIKNPTTLFPKYYINEQFSYPSGHTARAVFMGLAVIMVCVMHPSFFRWIKHKTLWGIGIGAYVGLVALSRIYLGHHWLSDIVGGAFLGAGFGLMAFLGFYEIKKS